MNFDKNAELVSAEVLKLNERFNVLENLQGDIQELLCDEERDIDNQTFRAMYDEITSLRMSVIEWITGVAKRIKHDGTDKLSARQSKKSKSSKASRCSINSSRAKALEAKAKRAELEARLAQLDDVEAAKKEAERVRLMAECAAANAVSKVYEDAIKEDTEQYLGSDDPDIEPDTGTYYQIEKKREQGCKSNGFPLLGRELNSQVVDGVKRNQPAQLAEKQLKDYLNPDVPELELPIPSPRHIVYDNVTGTVNNVTPKGVDYNSSKIYDETHASFWERMELRMSQPPPTPAPFDGNPAQYLRFRSNFGDQVENKISLSDSEKMNYLLAYTSGRARRIIENYQGLPNGCQIALQVLKQRFGQNTMIVEALKASVLRGPRLREGDSEALLTLSDKIENCCHAMEELNSSELDCTTNLKQIYDRLPDYLQAKWRKSVRMFRDKTGGREPTLKDFSYFISTESLAENDPVYRRSNSTPVKVKADTSKKFAFQPRFTDSMRVTTLATDVGKPKPTDLKYSSIKDMCKVCKGSHEIRKCPVFLPKSVNWRRRFSKFNALCYRCLSPSHLQRECPEKEGCTVQDCAHPSNHHSLLHLTATTGSPVDKEEGNSGQSSSPSTSLPVHNASVTDSDRGLVLLKVVPVRVVSEGGLALSTYGLLDTAAVSSMISSRIVAKLELQRVPERVSLNTVTHKNHDCELSQVKFHISSTSEEGLDLPVNHALEIEDLNVSNHYCPNQVDLSEWSHLRGVELPKHPVDVSEVSVLIGQDVPQAHIIFDYRWGNDPQNEPYATKTPFGWCVAGPINKREDRSKPAALSVFEFAFEENQSVVDLHKQVEKFWACESHGFIDSAESTKTIEDKRALEILGSTTKVTGGRYEVGLLWRTEDPILPNNRSQAEMRLQQLKKRFLRDPTFASQYEAVMNDYIEKGYAVKLSEKEAASTSDHTWYLPHHGVVNPNKSKVRVVYDAAAVWGGTSLNKELLQGPQLNNSLIGVLFRFRREEIAVASDIESMFHRVGCVERDTDALRFLWWSDGLNEPPSDHKMKVHLFGKADSPCIAAWTLQRTATDNAADFGNDVCDIVRKNFYVDDCLFSVPTAEEAIGASLQLMQLLKRGNFRLTKFISNDLKVLKAIPAEERTVKSLDLDKLPLERTLGLYWDTETDTLAVKVSLSHGKANCHTRRDCLSKLSSTFDPLGLICPVLLPAKRLMQRTWQLKLHWDDSLPEGLLEGWARWKEELLFLNHLSTPRCYFSGGCSRDASFELHHFSDASEYGYGTVCYLRKESGDGTVESTFIMAKSRCAPLQYVSVPRLELQAATIAARVHRLVSSEINLEISASFFWTDSKVTLQYVKNESRRFKTYVANRVCEIRSVSQPSQWRYCPSILNPADDASRGLTVHQLLTSERWFSGPAFLLNPKEEWPNDDIDTLSDSDPEIKNEKPIFVTTGPEKLREILTRYSSWTVLLRRLPGC
ncbi:uncharacterized protein [Acropora muricata]|uniref:uncharacterized protein n=1 Tax=Acropora muricata TaxID=159855 RepID=UPI0034E5BD58